MRKLNWVPGTGFGLRWKFSIFKGLLFGLVFLVSVFAVAGESIRVQCENEKSNCQVTLELADGYSATYSMQPAPRGFSQGFTVGYRGRTLKPARPFESSVFQSAQGLWATATLELDESGSRQFKGGVFSTRDRGMMEVKRNRDGSLEIRYDRKRNADFGKTVDSDASTLSIEPLLANSSCTGYCGTAPISFINPSTPGSCYAQDNLRHLAKISVLVDYGYYQNVTSGISDPQLAVQKVLQSIEELTAFARLIWLSQFNINLSIVHVEIGNASSREPLNWSQANGTCGGGASAVLGAARMLLKGQIGNGGSQWGGIPVFVSSCIGSDGVGGIASVGSFCRESSSGWAATMSDPLDFAHELGHSFGAHHTFESGTGQTGGIMDYGIGKFPYAPNFKDSQFQFHPYNKVDICPFINGSLGFCSALTGDPVASTCGNGILEPDEECECLGSRKKCSGCVACKLTQPKLNCSTSFVKRQANTLPYVVVSTELLSSPNCCINGKQAAPKTLCSGGQGVCSLGGACTSFCNYFGYAPCGTDASGCLQKCQVPNSLGKLTCQPLMGAYQPDPNPPHNPISLPVSFVEDGSKCFMPTQATTYGQCVQGKCTATNIFVPELVPAKQSFYAKSVGINSIDSKNMTGTGGWSGPPAPPQPTILVCSKGYVSSITSYLLNQVWVGFKLSCSDGKIAKEFGNIAGAVAGAAQSCNVTGFTLSSGAPGIQATCGNGTSLTLGAAPAASDLSQFSSACPSGWRSNGLVVSYDANNKMQGLQTICGRWNKALNYR